MLQAQHGLGLVGSHAFTWLARRHFHHHLLAGRPGRADVVRQRQLRKQQRQHHQDDGAEAASGSAEHWKQCSADGVYPLSPKRLRGHALALLGTPPARVGARLAMVHFVLGALFGTQPANLRAERTGLLCGLGAPRHVAGSQPTSCSTVHVQCNAPGHHLHVWFLQAGSCAVVAGLRTRVTRVDARLVLLMSHEKKLPIEVGPSHSSCCAAKSWQAVWVTPRSGSAPRQRRPVPKYATRRTWFRAAQLTWPARWR